MRVQTASVVGIPSKTTWSTTATVRLEGKEVFIACGFSGDDQAPHDGRKFVRQLEEISNPDPKAVYQYLEEFSNNLSKGTAASWAVVFKENGRSAIFSQGFGLVGLIRAGRGRWLADGQQDKVVLEGEIRDGDRLILATARAQELNLPLEQFASAEPDDVAAGLFAPVQTHSDSGEIAILFVRTLESSHSSVNSTEQVKSTDSQPPTSKPVEKAPAVAPTIAPPRHLVSPQRLQEGVLASATEQETQVQTALSQRDIIGSVRRHVHNRGTYIKLGIVLAVLLGLIFSMIFYRQSQVSAEYEEVIAPLEQMVQDALNLPPEQIGEQRAAVSSLLERLQATRVDYGANRRALDQLLIQLERKNDQISGERELLNLPAFYDFRLINAEFLASRASRERNRAVFLDRDSNLIIGLNLDNKQNETYPRAGLERARDISLIDSNAYVLQVDQVARSRTAESEVSQLINLTGASDPYIMDKFGSSLYVLDRVGQQIWRMGLEPEASPSGWVRSARGVDFSTVTSMVINGSIWLGTSDGDIYKLTRGERESFSTSGLVRPFTSTLLLSANEGGNKLVAVEPAQKRLVVLNKDGEYQLQIESEQIGAVTDSFLSEDESAVYLVAGSVLYRVEI